MKKNFSSRIKGVVILNKKTILLTFCVLIWMFSLHVSLFYSTNHKHQEMYLGEVVSVLSYDSKVTPSSYSCVVENVVDGDTIDVIVDLGFGILRIERIRLVGIDTPELNSSDKEEREAALGAKTFVIDELENAKKTTLITNGSRGKYGRLIADISYDGKLLTHEILKRKLGKEYE